MILIRKAFLVHRLVATAFIGESKKKCVNHMNGNSYDNNVENLEWVTHSENSLHAMRTGLMNKELTYKGVIKIDPVKKILSLSMIV